MTTELVSEISEAAILLLYFLEFFPRVLLISSCASMRVQFKGENKTRAGTINIATLPHLYVHCAPSELSPNKYEICTWIVANQPNSHTVQLSDCK